ncbi:PSD1 and planctomycete cytochrome C domain-containing protein [Cyclobacterium sp. SYSU L10401]|uniref:PSD1 and planctomycete cytochrome C domain-containing protein n=1 Tax=Cyclobacterium sp. SYSU L10401 TaxID=2678657 RepID=UPI001F08ABA9|nr:PSD1 and planctomycete cytochrome C domain-containing protein [Cyclobacterium sp. SYSU L10401]
MVLKDMLLHAVGRKWIQVFGPLLIFIMGLLVFFSCQRNELAEEMPAQVDFNYHIKPILVQKCYLCHGPDPSSREAGLRLDVPEGATKLLESGHAAIVPGSASKSNLLDRITQNDPELRMPPPSSKLELSEKEIALLKKWVAQGAEYQPHWSFIPPKMQQEHEAIPTHQIIDGLLDKKIQESAISASERADKYSLLRRLSLVLTGLPPDPEIIHSFVANEDPKAYEQLVDQYLQSPAFGEKWASHWMDVVRYAETKGHEFDYEIQGAWKYRDYLIRAFNADVPYDQLVREHLMGDLLPVPRIDPETGHNESVIATLFLTMTEGTHSPVDTKKDEADRIDNMIDVIGKSFQGLTVACSRCHDHKFDPIPTSDYYALYGILGSTRFSPVPLGDTQMKTSKIKEAHQLKRQIKEMLAASWKGQSQDSVPVFFVHDQSPAEDKGIEKNVKVLGDFRGQDFDGWLADGWAFGQSTTLGDPLIKTGTGQLVGLSPGMASSRKFGPGKYGALRSGNFTLENKHLGVRARGKGGSIRLVMDNFQLISYPIYGGLDQKVNEEEWKNYVFDVGDWLGHEAYIEILPGRYVRHQYEQDQEAYIEAAYAIAYDESWLTPPLDSHSTAGSLSGMLDSWQAGNSRINEVTYINKGIEDGNLETEFPDLVNLVLRKDLLQASVADSIFIQGVADGLARESPVFNRGNHLDTGNKVVERSFLSEILDWQNPIQTKGSGRAKMTETILDPKNPLTARVMVNRIWYHVFGKGLVETVDNFGLQGKLPSHPELLDFLAIKFQEENWSVKKMIKAMVMTEAFQRSTEKNGRDLDPENIYLAHYPVRRLEAEAIRDAMLFSSGALDSSLQGPPVPVYLTSFMQGRGRPGKSGPLDGAGRRSIYLEVRRNFLDRMMMAFDRPTPFTTFGRRDVTNVPAQSLFLMNDPFVAEQAEIMAKSLIAAPGLSTAQRINEAYLRAFSRPASEFEREKGLTFLREIGDSLESPDGIPSEEKQIQVWKEYCHALFNMKSFIYLM